MGISPSVKERIKSSVQQSSDLYMMNKEQIFLFLAELAAISDELADLSYENDLAIAEKEKEVIGAEYQTKVSASMMSHLIKDAIAPYVAEKEWIKNQLNLVNSLRISALSAQRSSE